MDFVSRLRSLVGEKNTGKKIQKSDLPGGEDPALDTAANGEPDLEMATTEIIDALNSGELEPDTEAISQYMQGKGFSQEDAAEYSSMILDSYFNTEGEETDIEDGTEEAMDESFPEDEELSEVEKSALLKINQLDQGVKSIQKSLSMVKQNKADIELIQKGLITLIENQHKLMKSLETFGLTPAPGTQKPITKSFVKGNVKMDKKETEELIRKGVLAGAYSIEHLIHYQTAGEVTPEANTYISKAQKSGGDK